jgi:hypothetical protein
MDTSSFRTVLVWVRSLQRCTYVRHRPRRSIFHRPQNQKRWMAGLVCASPLLSQVCQERLVQNNFGAAIEVLNKSSDLCKFAMRCGVEEGSLEEIAVSVVETMILQVLESQKVADVTKGSASSISMLTEFLNHAVAAAKSPGFLAHGMCHDLTRLRTVMMAKTCDATDLVKVLDAIAEDACGIRLCSRKLFGN